MYLAKLELNARNHDVRKDLSDSHKLHQRIMQAFPDERREKARADWQVLFRQEPESEVILVSSAIEGAWDNLPPDYLRQFQSKSFEPEMQQFELGRLMQFRLKANPSKRDNQSRKLIGLFNQSDQLAWLERQGNNHGFNLKGVDVIPTANAFGKKPNGKAPIRLTTVLYQGILEIVDSDRFITALEQGIGRGRSYGCGLLSVAKLQY